MLPKKASSEGKLPKKCFLRGSFLQSLSDIDKSTPRPLRRPFILTMNVIDGYSNDCRRTTERQVRRSMCRA